MKDKKKGLDQLKIVPKNKDTHRAEKQKTGFSKKGR